MYVYHIYIYIYIYAMPIPVYGCFSPSLTHTHLFSSTSNNCLGFEPQFLQHSQTHQLPGHKGPVKEPRSSQRLNLGNERRRCGGHPPLSPVQMWGCLHAPSGARKTLILAWILWPVSNDHSSLAAVDDVF